MTDETPMTPEEIGAFKTALFTLMRRGDGFPGASFSHDDRWHGLPRNGVRIVRGKLVLRFDGVNLTFSVMVAPNVEIRVGNELGPWWSEIRKLLTDLQNKLMISRSSGSRNRATSVESMRRAFEPDTSQQGVV